MSDILYSKLHLIVPSELDGENAIITSSKGISRNVTMSSPVTDVTLAGMEKYTVQVGYNNENISFGYGEIKEIQAKFLPDDSLENTTWQKVSDIIKDGVFSQYASIGDTKTFMINNKTYTAEVVSINNGAGDAGQWYPENTVDFITKELYETEYMFNSRSGSSSYKGLNAFGFTGSAIKNTLNNTIYPLLPTDLKNVIIDKSHSYQSGCYGVTNASSNWSSLMVTLETKLWLPTYYEIAGSTHSYAPGETSFNNKPYILASKTKKKVGENNNKNWWIASPYIDSPYYAWICNTGGNMTYNDTSYSSTVGVPLCFRIG